ncbi:hypothetical protein CERZMDRAFT_121657 [Cercospora zeae-maydis SCOH1-5]|uniref:Uncharacterized protein n=1 Tax=Cercospora zeae-maydis SCOH1-5 TaxID=717836 RepID=A0A6A6FBG4_9PEZI|nr:hypothetical protein CERZMDRAFT_121657 [Cercospora zeae-maydis SCOH1-5]
MGVTGLWQIVQPCARPIKLETLHRKRLAVDASIWIYQFLKAVRDKEGNALRNSHVVGFFRRICKLLFFGIKPVFVFDGGAPALKRQTIRARKSRREGRREDAVRTAGKLLAVQMQRAAEEEVEHRRKEQQQQSRSARDGNGQQEEQVPDEGLVYVEELQMSAHERQQNRKFRKKDAYHLPDLDVSINEMGGANDPRVMSLEELQVYAAQFNTGEELAIYDFSKIDYDSSFFMSLPASDRYNILNAARLRSRLRMGHSKEQLDLMFPDRMAFSRFQIERVAERNELTQRLMHLNESGGAEYGGGRVMGEKGREYVLVKNEGVEGGWALGVIDDEGKEEKPIDLDAVLQHKQEQEEWEDDVDFEDVPVEGLNRLPQAKSRDNGAIDAFQAQRMALYRSRSANDQAKDDRFRRPPRRKRRNKSSAARDPESLFVGSSDDDADGQEWEDVDVKETAVPRDAQITNDEDLQAAIALSMHDDLPESDRDEGDAADTEMLDAFQQHAPEDAQPIPSGRAKEITHVLNQRAHHVALESHKGTSFGTLAQKTDDRAESSDDDVVDLQAALAESGRTQRRTNMTPLSARDAPKTSESSTKSIAKKAGFSGPLPFEQLDLGTSLLGKKKMQQRAEEAAGGFEHPELADQGKSKAEPLPPWFSGDVEKDLAAQRRIDIEDGRRAKQFDNRRFQFQERGDLLRRAHTDEIIDLDGENDKTSGRKQAVIDLSAEVVASDHELDPKQAASANLFDWATGHNDIQNDAAAEGIPDVMNANGPSAGVAQSEVALVTTEFGTTSVYNSGMHQAGQESPSMKFEDVSTQQGGATAAVDPSSVVEGDVSEDAAFEDLPGFSDPEDAEILRNLATEAEEHARFASALNRKTQAQNIADYENELRKLRNQQKKDRRDADEVTQTMIQECQALLSFFGLPYITAPMEAEAQCAELVRLGLVDGIVTDDSDCFLFGGTRIYKNMFNQAKFVECYLSTDLEKEFDLTREKLIAVASLLGSDYTEGLPGVGPVTALEIISEFPSLEDFKDWWTAVQMNQVHKSEDASNPFRKKFRRNASKLFLPHGFPDKRVRMAYLEPEVDSDPQAFQWGVPDLEKLRSFLMATIGWTQERTDEVLVPVIKDMNRRLDDGTQANITAFFAGGVGVGAAASNQSSEASAPRKRITPSKRMATMQRSEDAEQADEDGEIDHTNRKPASPTSTGTADDTGSEYDGPVAKKQKRRPRTQKVNS